MAKKVAIAIHKVPGRDIHNSPNFAYGGWIWVGPDRFVDNVERTLNADPKIASAIRLGAEFQFCPEACFTPAQLRRIEAEVQERLTTGPLVRRGFEGEPSFELPLVERHARPRNFDLIRFPVLIPTPAMEYAWDLVQWCAEVAETARSNVKRQPRSRGAILAVHRDGNAGRFIQALLEMRATCPERLQSTKSVALRASDSHTGDAFKKVVIQLKSNGLVATNHRGVWLTKKGVTSAQKMVDEGASK